MRAVHIRSRLRTSLVLSGRPDLLRNRCSRGAARRTAAIRERRPAPLQVVPQRRQRHLAHGHVARLAALALHPQLLPVVVDIGASQRHDLLRAQAARVGELEHRPVAQLEAGAGGDALQQRPDLAAP